MASPRKTRPAGATHMQEPGAFESQSSHSAFQPPRVPSVGGRNHKSNSDHRSSSSMTTQSLQRHPKCAAFYASRTRRDSEDAAEATPLAPSVAYLANVTVEVTTKTQARGSTTFALTVHDHKSNSTWRHLRTYAECRAFQTDVLRSLSRGHLCFAECPWLYAYVQRALPADRTGRHLFRVAGHSSKPRIVEDQRQALARLFTTLQSVLLNPLNQKCAVLMQQVAPEVIRFVTNRNDADEQAPWQQHSPTNFRSLARTFSESMMENPAEKSESFGQTSTTTTASIEDLDEDVVGDADDTNKEIDSVVAGQRVCCAMCALHKTRSDEQVFAGWRAETISSRFMRLRADHSSIVAQTDPASKGVWESPTFSQCVTSPLEATAVLGGHDANVVLSPLDHDGTPTEPFPGSPGTPRDSSSSSSFSSSVCELDIELIDSWRLSDELPLKKTDQRRTAPQVETSPLHCSGLKKIRCIPRRSLHVLSSLRRKLTGPSHAAIVI